MKQKHWFWVFAVGCLGFSLAALYDPVWAVFVALYALCAVVSLARSLEED